MTDEQLILLMAAALLAGMEDYADDSIDTSVRVAAKLLLKGREIIQETDNE